MAFPHDGKKFKKGESGNPLGRPSYKALEEELREMAYRIAKAKKKVEKDGKEVEIETAIKIDGREATFHEVILQKMMNQAAQGDDRARKEYLNRMFGSSKETIDIGNADGLPFMTESNVNAEDKEIIQRYIKARKTKENPK